MREFFDTIIESAPNSLIRQAKKTHVPHKPLFSSTGEALNWLEEKHIGLRLDEVNLICLDIDDQVLFERLLQAFTEAQLDLFNLIYYLFNLIYY